MALGQVPESANLRAIMSTARKWDHVGPSTLNAIASIIQDVRRRLPSESSIDPSPLFIQYGERSIAGFAPQAANARWHRGADAGNGLGAGLPESDVVQPIGAVSLTPRVVAKAIKDSNPIAAKDNPASGPIDLGLYVAPVTISELKASLAEGQPFSFLFLHSAGVATIAQPANGHEAPATGDNHTEAYAATAVGYDDKQQAFLIVKQSADPDQEGGEIGLLSYAYWTHPILSQDVWTIWKAKPQ